MMKTNVLILALVVSGSVSAQKRQTTYYPNGNKEFEGVCYVVGDVADGRDLLMFDTASDRMRANMITMMGRMPQREQPVKKIYHGQCSFYYPNGKLSHSGNYDHGVKDGDFNYYYIDGSKERACTYVAGMMDGKVQTWYRNGLQQSVQYYKALTKDELDSAAKMNGSGRPSGMFGGPLQEHNKLRTFGVDSFRKLLDNTFSKFAEMENSFFRGSHWDGDFVSYYPNGEKCTEMHYQNDVRVGTWHYWSDSAKENVVLKYEKGKIVRATNNLPTDKRLSMPGMPDREAMKRVGYRDSLRTGKITLPRPEMPDMEAMKRQGYRDSLRSGKVNGFPGMKK